MDERRASRQRAYSNQSEPRSPDARDTAARLTRARSQEFSIVESVAVPDDPIEDSDSISDDASDAATTTSWPRRVRYQVLLCAFLTSLSFGVTQVPLLYVFRLMTCDAYYDERPQDPALDPSGTESVLSYAYSLAQRSSAERGSDRCSLNAIESATALSISLLGASTTVFGILNLFLTARLIKRIGIKSTLLIQVFFPALRLLVQNVGVEAWGKTGIIIIQCSQIVSIIGGPSGYLLALNTFTTDVVEHEERTAALGRLTGSQMFGSALGFLLGGVVADAFGNKAPFRLTLALFLIASVYVVVALPYVPLGKAAATHHGSRTSRKRGGFTKYAGLLAVFAPRKFIGADDLVRTEYGSFLLAWGVFLGILATGYIPTLLQLYATDVFGFGTKKNGLLIFMFSMLRGSFLTFVFPKLITLGRRLSLKRREHHFHAYDDGNEGERDPLLMPANQAPASDITAGSHKQGFAFDLMYTRFSLLIDGLLTLLCSFVGEGWQMYIVAAVLPFGSGTGSAAKGTILHMVGSDAGSSERTDALAGVSLVENMARLSTTFVFGVIFAGFASIGRTELVFVCNAGVALIGFIVLVFARFPPNGSRQLEDESDPGSDI